MKKLSFEFILHLVLLFGICAAIENNGSKLLFTQRYGQLTCFCGEGAQTYNYLNNDLTEKILNHLETLKGTFFSVDDYRDLKMLAPETCLKCEITKYECKNNGKDGAINCLKKSSSFNLNGNFTIDDVPHQRFARQSIDCAYPSSLQTASVNCYKYPSYIKCKQSCAFGYTLKNGIEQDMDCKYRENKWKPSGFKECEPFVDCTVSVTSGGSAVCKSPLLTVGPECNVQCSAHEDKEAISEYRTTCNIDGSWEPPLPFCMSAGTGIVLAKAPEVRLHMP